MSDVETASFGPADLELLEELGSYAYNPRGFVQWAFPWGEPHTELANFREPYAWQIEYLEQVGDDFANGRISRQATTSGHGTGKSALNGMETWWAFSTFPGTRGVITANTENQLRTKTWVEMAKWHRLFLAKHLFKYTASALFSIDPSLAREWRIDMVPWSENNTEAFAGMHNAGKRIIALFDEASRIDDLIWETMEGALTDSDTEILWSVKGNPTRNQGRFRECFEGGKFAHRWTSREIDASQVPGTNKAQIAEWIKDYGADSDFCRVRIFGRFPRQDQSAFISRDAAVAASLRPLEGPGVGPIILGVDVGRFGGDPTVIYPRQGVDARTRPPEVYFGLNTLQVVERIAAANRRLRPAVIYVDEGGIGAGVVDLAQAKGLPVIGIQFGAGPSGTNPDDAERGIKYANKRAEMWGAVKSWLRRGCIRDAVGEFSLVEELGAPTYDYQLKTEALVLEAKKAMVARGVASPNVADALALTFALPVIDTEDGSAVETAPVDDYNPFAQEYAA